MEDNRWQHESVWDLFLNLVPLDDNVVTCDVGGWVRHGGWGWGDIGGGWPWCEAIGEYEAWQGASGPRTCCGNACLMVRHLVSPWLGVRREGGRVSLSGV